MRQRVGLAQSLINDPEIVFMDEPMSGLDPVGRRQVRELISELRDEGKTVFMSSHILTDIEALCDNVAILNGGKLLTTGKLSDLLAVEATKSGFEVLIGSVEFETLEKELSGTELVKKPNGTICHVESEESVAEVVSKIVGLDGRLISVTPTKQSLEELFVKEKSE